MVNLYHQQILPRLARQFNVSVEYLMEGGEEKDGESMYAGAQVQGKKIIPFSPTKNDNIVYVPFYEDVKASAGSGAEVEDYSNAAVVPILRSFIGPYNPSTVKTLEITGDSMINIHLFSGDIVFFVPVNDPSDGLYVIGIDDRLYVKHLEFDILGQEIRIISENDRYKMQVLQGDNMNRLRVVGKVIGWITRHPY